MPITQRPSWATLAGKPTNVAGLGLSDFEVTAVAAHYTHWGGVGSHAFMGTTDNTYRVRSSGSVAAASVLRWAGVYQSGPWGLTGANANAMGDWGGPASGTWVCMGTAFGNAGPNYGATLWIRAL